MHGALVLVVLVALGFECRADDALPPSVLDASADQVTARIEVPDTLRKVGEVRLVQRGSAVVVQTLLSTLALPRVVAEIRKKEAENWPEDGMGHDDMERYMAAITRVADALRAERNARSGGDRRLRMLIELIATPGIAGLVVGGFDGGEVDGHLQPAARHPREVIALGKTYVFRNMRLILADSFHLAEGDVDRLGPLGPIARAP